MKARRRGLAIALGGVAWLGGVVTLETTYQETNDSFPVAFPLLALLAGLSVGWGLWTAAMSLDLKAARIGARLVAAAAAALGIGFGLDLVPGDAFLGFLLAYSVGLFVLPIGFIVLGIGLLRSSVIPQWASWIALSVAAVGGVTYGFHAVAPEIWDPSDVVWYAAIGVGWLLLGVAVAGSHPTWEAPTGGLILRT